MLLITRKINDTLVIDGDITIKVTSIRGSYVTLGIDAPQHRHVLRSELIEPGIQNKHITYPEVIIRKNLNRED